MISNLSSPFWLRYFTSNRTLTQNFFVSTLIYESGLTLDQAWLSRTKPGLNLIKYRIRMYLANSLNLVLTKRSITVSSLSPVLALQRQRRQKRQRAQWSEIKNSIYNLYCLTQFLLCTLYGLNSLRYMWFSFKM